MLFFEYLPILVWFNTMEIREFFIENRLEKYRKLTSCNLGESGFKNFKLGDILNIIGLEAEDLKMISLEDSPNSGSEE